MIKISEKSVLFSKTITQERKVISMKKYGVFISYRHADWALAGRIYDFLSAKGLCPFWDSTSMCQGSFPDTLKQEIQQAPYFLCVLTPNTFADLSPSAWIYKEIKLALSDPGKKILLVADTNFQWPAEMPEEIARIQEQHYDPVDRTTFRSVMEQICQRSIDWNSLSGVLDWRQRLKSLNNICLANRERIERTLAPLADRFGPELVHSIQQNQEFTGQNRIRFIHMSCYAASIIFSPQQDMVDERAFDLGLMFNIFAKMLQDPEFSLELVINAPGSFAMQDAIDREKLGNSALEAYQEAIFLSSYSNIHRLIQEEPSFAQAYKEKRFRFMVTENVLPYALFQVEYKPGFEEYSHVKVDLYSEGLTSNMDRRCMMIFKQDDPDNYSFFVRCYEYTRNVRESKALMKAHHAQWLAQWEELKEELE